MIYGFYAVGIFLASAFLTGLVSIKSDKYVPHIPIAASLVAVFLTVITLPDVFFWGAIKMQMEEWVAPIGISIVADTLSVTLALITTVVAFLVLLFSYRYISRNNAKYYSLLSLMFAGVLGILYAGDIFNMFIFFEVLSISSYGLVAFYRNRVSLEAGIKYLIMGSVATSMLLLGIAMLYGATGTVNMADLALKLPLIGGIIPAVALALIMSGIALKAGIFPFHAWIADAYEGAPSPVSAALSGIGIKAGVYAMLRVVFIVFNAPGIVLDMLLVFGVASMLIGALLALGQDNLKRMLAYSSISQMGYIFMAIGLGTALGTAAGMLHIVNHMIIKSLLFLSAGTVLWKAKSTNMKEIANTVRTTPLMTYSFLFGVLALAGIPLFNGFVSKWLIYVATFEKMPFLTLIAIVTSAITLAYGLKAFYAVFLSNEKAGVKVTLPMSMKIPLIVLIALIIVLGVMPQIGIWLAEMMSGSLNPSLYTGVVLG